MREFQTTSLADRVFQKLEDDIIFGAYPRGEILTELKLVEQLGVSRTPIREALRRLEQERLIQKSGKGSVVLGITEDDFLDIMSIRQHIEGLASYYAAINRSDSDIKELEYIMELQSFYSEKEDTDHFRQFDDRFHDMICDISGRTVIKDTLLPLLRKTQRYCKASMELQNRFHDSIREHRGILDAIIAKDGKLAEQLAAQHTESAKDKMLEGLKKNG